MQETPDFSSKMLLMPFYANGTTSDPAKCAHSPPSVVSYREPNPVIMYPIILFSSSNNIPSLAAAARFRFKTPLLGCFFFTALCDKRTVACAAAD